MLENEDNLEVIGATQSTQAELAAFRETTGANYAILYGLSDATKQAYGVTSFPSIVVLKADGTVAGRDDQALQKCLDN